MASICANEPKLFLSLHCGAGVFAKKHHKRYKEVMKNACKAAHIEFKKTKCVRSSVIAATEYLENSELINAGYGSSLTLHKTVECDAGIINVNDQKWAAMTAISNIINPIKAVETLYIKSKEPLSNGRISPIFLCGISAENWCKDNNVAYHNTFELTKQQQHIFTQYSNAIHNNNDNDDEDITMNSKDKKRKLSDPNDMYIPPTKKRKLNGSNGIYSSDNNHGTCGVIGYDTATQRMYVTTSSGGIWMKYPGRIGPSAIVGSGFDGKQRMCDDGNVFIGCCASGSGEYLMQYRLAEKCCQGLMHYEVHRNECDADIMDENVLSDVFDGFRESVADSECIRTAGCLVMKVLDNKDGVDININWVHNSNGMGVGVLCDGEIKTYMSVNDERDRIVISGHQCCVYQGIENIGEDKVFMSGLEILNRNYKEGDHIEYDSDHDAVDTTKSHVHKGQIIKIYESEDRNYGIVIKDDDGAYGRYSLNRIRIKLREKQQNMDNTNDDNHNKKQNEREEQDIDMKDENDDNMDVSTSDANVNILKQYASDLPSYMIPSPINEPD